MNINSPPFKLRRKDNKKLEEILYVAKNSDLERSEVQTLIEDEVENGLMDLARFSVLLPCFLGTLPSILSLMNYGYARAGQGYWHGRIKADDWAEWGLIAGVTGVGLCATGIYLAMRKPLERSKTRSNYEIAKKEASII